MYVKYYDALEKLRLLKVKDSNWKSIEEVKVSKPILRAIDFFNLDSSRISKGLDNCKVNAGVAFKPLENGSIGYEDDNIKVFMKPIYESGSGYSFNLIKKGKGGGLDIFALPSIKIGEVVKSFNELCKFINPNYETTDNEAFCYLRYNFLNKNGVLEFSENYQDDVEVSELEEIAYKAIDVGVKEMNYLENIPNTPLFEIDEAYKRLFCGDPEGYNASLSEYYGDTGYKFSILNESWILHSSEVVGDFKELVGDFNRVAALIKFLNGGCKNAT